VKRRQFIRLGQSQVIHANNARSLPRSRRRRKLRWRRLPSAMQQHGPERPHPRLPHRHRCGLHDAADDGAVCEHVELVVIPLAGDPPRGRALEDERGHFHAIV
jgi:hypothetical protein